MVPVWRIAGSCVKITTMGWDAHTKIETEIVNNRLRIKNKAIRESFKKAYVEVKKIAGAVDGFLDFGDLDCSTCRDMLTKATGINGYEDGFTSDQVVELNKNANWNFKFPEEDAWAYWSARKWLEVCAELKLSIYFSY